jgi:hypothetical protein
MNDEFRNRKMTTRVLTLCTECNELKEDTKVRQIRSNSIWFNPTEALCCLACSAKIAKRLEDEVIDGLRRSFAQP